MSIFKKVIFSKKRSNHSVIKNSLLAGTVLLSTVGQDVFAKEKSYVAVEPLTCDLVKSIALPSDEVTCLVDRKQDVHDLKICLLYTSPSPRDLSTSRMPSSA